MAESDSTPAWMVCDELISKMRDELLSQAVSAMHEQIEKKHLALEGNVVTTSEEGGEKERDAFLLGQIAKEHNNIERQFAMYMEHASIDKEAMAHAEELQKFLLELRQIVMLSDYAKECEGWLSDAEKELRGSDPAAILAKTMKAGERRREVLDYALKSRKFSNDGVFSVSEKRLMQDALERA
ncbi:MAG: hypothetical protein M1286_04325 [Candidatus Marsarchaeota archaeon]|nr:hypothetical protein [Candidatus Marsarchaeota archaeon]